MTGTRMAAYCRPDIHDQRAEELDYEESGCSDNSIESQ